MSFYFCTQHKNTLQWMRDTFWVIFTDIEVFLCKYESSFKKSWFLYLYIILKTARWNYAVILSLWKICNKNRKCNWFYEMHGERERESRWILVQCLQMKKETPIKERHSVLSLTDSNQSSRTVQCLTYLCIIKHFS